MQIPSDDAADILGKRNAEFTSPATSLLLHFSIQGDLCPYHHDGAIIPQSGMAARSRAGVYGKRNDLMAMAFGPLPAGSIVNTECSPGVPSEAVRTTATSDERASTTNSR